MRRRLLIIILAALCSIGVALASEPLVVSSPTHPDPDQWYSANTAKFEWPLLPDVLALRLAVTREADVVPYVLYEPPATEKEIADLADGVWYFHAQTQTAEGWDGITHFRFQIDTEPPEHFALFEKARPDLTDPKIKLALEASDALSGIDRYEIDLGASGPTLFWRGAPGEIYETSPLPPGTHAINARAFDRAGNTLAASAIVTVLAPPSAWWRWGEKALAALSLSVPLLAVVILLGLMLERSHAYFRRRRRLFRQEERAASLSKTSLRRKKSVKKEESWT